MSLTPSAHRNRPATAGFTLVELLVVVLIISILSGMILIGVRKLVERQKLNGALTDIEQMRHALEQYEQAWGEYPPADMFGDQLNGPNRALVACLAYEYDDAVVDPADPRHGPFLEDYLIEDTSRIKARTIDGQQALLWLDPWENPYVYFERNTMRDYNNGDEPRYQILGNALDYADGMHFRPRKDEAGLFYDATRFQIWSCGPDKRSSLEGLPTDAAARDDITSWNAGASR